MHDSLGDRMKRQYEDRTRVMLPRRTYTILRADGKSFHTYTRQCDKPHDARLSAAMDAATLALCREAQGSVFAYVQSDEISVLLMDFATITTDAWFDANLQKVVSVAASVVTEAFNRAHGGRAHFDCRAFTIPDPVEVENYFVWRQQDAARNSIQGLAQAHFSHKQLHGLNVNELQERLFQDKGINWNDLPAAQKRGRCCVYQTDIGWCLDDEPPIFTKDRDYIRQQIALGLPQLSSAPATTDTDRGMLPRAPRESWDR